MKAATAEGEKKRLGKLLTTTKAAHEEDQKNLQLMVASLKLEQDKNKYLTDDGDKMSRGISVLQGKLAKEKKRVGDAFLALEQLRAEVASLWTQIKNLLSHSDEALIKAFKASLAFEQLQLEFAHPTFEVGKLHVCRATAAEGVKLSDLTRWVFEDQYSRVTHHGHALVPYNSEELEDIKKVDVEEEMPTWAPSPTLSPNVVQNLLATGEGRRSILTLRLV